MALGAVYLMSKVYYGAVENLMTKVYLGPMSVLWPLEGREVADWAYLGIGDLDVPWALGVYRGPPEVYRGPCMKITP